MITRDNQLYRTGHSVVRWTGAINDLTGAYLNSATVTARLYDEDDAAVGSAVTLDYVAASNGDYAGTVLDTVVQGGFAVGDPYKIVLSLTSGSVVGSRTIRGVVKEAPQAAS